MTPREELDLLSTLRALAMDEFCGAIVPVGSPSEEVDVEDDDKASDPEWQVHSTCGLKMTIRPAGSK